MPNATEIPNAIYYNFEMRQISTKLLCYWTEYSTSELQLQYSELNIKQTLSHHLSNYSPHNATVHDKK